MNRINIHPLPMARVNAELMVSRRMSGKKEYVLQIDAIGGGEGTTILLFLNKEQISTLLEQIGRMQDD